MATPYMEFRLLSKNGDDIGGPVGGRAAHGSDCVSHYRPSLFWAKSIRPIETVSPEGTFCDTVQVPSSVGDMELN